MYDNGDCMYRFDCRDSSCLIGRRIVLDGRDGTIVEVIGNMRFGAHIDGYTHQGVPITVDVRRSEFILPRRIK